MKKMALSFLTLLPSVLYADQLVTFTDIANAVSQGKVITLVMNFQECTSQKAPVSSVIGSVRPNAFLVVNNNRITASERHFTLENPVSRGNPTFEFVKFNINADGSVSIKDTVMKATDYQQLANFQIDCVLNQGIKAFD